MMITTPTRPTRRAPVPSPAPARSMEEVRDVAIDPAGLGDALRDLATRAHRAVRAIDRPPGRDGLATSTTADPLRELAELHPRIADLHRSVEAAGHAGLTSYLAALLREVERRMG